MQDEQEEDYGKRSKRRSIIRRETREANEAIGGEGRCLDDPIAQDVDAGGAGAQPVGPHCPTRKEEAPPTRHQLGLCEECPLQVIILHEGPADIMDLGPLEGGGGGRGGPLVI